MNHFGSSDEVSDEDFLRRSKPSNYLLETSAPTSSAYDMRRQELLRKRQEIEDRTVDSSHRSLGLLYESEKVGLATAEELNRQKEQLKQTERRLDDINATLRTSERHLQGVKSVFGGIMNYFAGRGGGGGGRSNSSGGGGSNSNNNSAKTNTTLSSNLQPPQQQPQHSRIQPHNQSQFHHQPQFQQQHRPMNNADAILDRNLDEMSSGLSRLKHLAEGLNSELQEHDEILDRIDDGMSKNAWRIEKQNKEMNKILKK